MIRHRVEYLNTGLILLALVLGILLPFELFLLAYAFIGPLHYLSEINWLERKNFLMPERGLFKPLVVLAIAVTLPKIFDFLNVSSEFVRFFQDWSNVLLFAALAFSISWTIAENRFVRWSLLVASFIIAGFLRDKSLFIFVVGALLPTLIHVYIFTGLFMLSGAIRSGSWLGMLNVILLVLAPFIIASVPVDPNIYTFSEMTKETFISNGFPQLIVQLRYWMGISSNEFLFYDPLVIRFQAFIAFAYFYHYLNWFSKTGVIGWGEALRGRRAYVVISLWLVIALTYLINYRIGFMSSLLLSVLHVALEFPLNILSLRTIFLTPLNRWLK